MITSHNLIKQRVLIVGSNGMLGQKLCEFYASKPSEIELLAASAEDSSFIPGLEYLKIDLTKRESVKEVVYDFVPDLIVNAAAFTNVDQCETQRELSWKINVKGVEYLAECSRILECRLIHISSDYVFDGKNGPYQETDRPNPISYYGREKLAAENALRISGAIYSIVRTNVLYGPVKNGRADFVRWVYDSLKNAKPIRIVNDQYNNPTFLEDLVQGIHKIYSYNKDGIYHIGGAEVLHRYDFTLKIADFFQLDKSLITPITTAELNQPAPRPLKSGLITLKAQSELNYKATPIYETLVKMKKDLGL
ncbi:MAG TPA: dTDP-4-dehydrorhamnose reductase [Ignavibacteriales bacterium]|nr:dTDP-4-dehydrorhamnose reductase [Ignavibacteriales bacterium]